MASTPIDDREKSPGHSSSRWARRSRRRRMGYWVTIRIAAMLALAGVVATPAAAQAPAAPGGKIVVVDVARILAKSQAGVAAREKLGKDKKYYLIVEKRGAAVVFASPESDITDDIIKAYDQDSGKGKKP